jgi:hypothetical protein
MGAEIEYPIRSLTAEGALIYDENVSGKRPASLMRRIWMGRTAWVRITWFRNTCGREVPIELWPMRRSAPAWPQADPCG